jgi:ubiquinone/menaquinone biosynthesis C-methylase UbiE
LNRHDVFRRLLKTGAFARLYTRVIGPASVRMFAEPLREELLAHVPEGGRVLEVGCGPGLQALDVMRARPDLELTASDFSAAFVALGTANAARAGVAVKFVVADAMDLSDFAPASFDAVYSVTAIKHFPDPVRGLRECLRVLKSDGQLFVAEIRRESTLEEVGALAASFEVPPWLKQTMTDLVHGRLRKECPPLEEVQRWLSQVGAPEARPLAGFPAWVATFTR